MDDLSQLIEATQDANGDAPEPKAEKPKAKAPAAVEPEPAPAEVDPAPGVNDTGDDEPGDDGEEDGDQPKGKKRSKPLTKRLSEETARRRDAEQRAADLEARFAALEARVAPKEEAPVPAEPKAEDFEFGAADPAYHQAHAKWTVETTLAARDAEQAQLTEAARAKEEFNQNINRSLLKAETEGKAKYEDFEAVIAEAVETRGPLSGMTSLGIAISPVGSDLAYRLATDDVASDRLERLAKGGAQTAPAFALALGELEGEYIEDGDDSDLDMSDQLDMARMMGRMRARLKGAKAPAVDLVDERPEVPFTRAPEPPQHRVKGSSSRTQVPVDTDDTGAFFRQYGDKLKI